MLELQKTETLTVVISMNLRRIYLVIFFAGLIALDCFAQSPSEQSGNAGSDLRVGMAESDITPPIGFPMAGYYHERLAEGHRVSRFRNLRRCCCL
jgi:hypothetical protein